MLGDWVSGQRGVFSQWFGSCRGDRPGLGAMILYLVSLFPFRFYLWIVTLGAFHDTIDGFHIKILYGKSLYLKSAWSMGLRKPIASQPSRIS